MSIFQRIKAALTPADAVPLRRELMGQAVEITHRDRWDETSPAKGITPAKLESILRHANDGDIKRLIDLAYDIEERDSHMAGVLQTRKAGVLSLDWRVRPGASDDPQALAISEAASDAMMGIGNLEFALLDLLDAVSKPLAVCEIMWDVSSGQAVPLSLDWKHQRKFRYLMGTRPGDAINELRMLTDKDRIYGEPLPPHKLIVHQPRSRSGWQCRAGLIRVLSWSYLFKTYSIKDWATFCELYGIPTRVGKYDASMSDKDIRAFKRAISEMGSDAAAVVNKAHDIEFISRGTGSGEGVFSPFISYIDTSTSKAVLGHSGSADSTPGRLGGEDTATEVRSDLLRADAYALAATLRRDLLTPWTRFNYGATAAVPVFEFVIPEVIDLERESKIDEALYRMQVPLKLDEIYDRYGRSKPDAGDDTLIQPPPTGPAGFRAQATAAVQAQTPDTNDDISADDELETLTKASVKASMDWYEHLRNQITDKANKAESLSGLLVDLMEFAPDADPLADVLLDAIYTAHLYGMATAWDEAQEDDSDDPVQAARYPMAIEARLNPKPPEKALRQFDKRISVPYSDYQRLEAAARRKAFSLAYLESQEVVTQVKSRIRAAVEKGDNLRSFRSGLTAMYDAIGITESSPFHTELVFRNANTTSFNAARMNTQRQPEVINLRPYWRFNGIADDRQSDVCAEMDGGVWRADDPIWDTNYPDNHHGCRSKVTSLSQRQVDRRGITVRTARPTAEPDKGWAVRPSIEE